MQATATRTSWKQIGMLLIVAAFLLAAVLSAPWLCFLVALLLPLFLVPLAQSSYLAFLLGTLISCIPSVALVSLISDMTLAFCLATIPLLNFFLSRFLAKHRQPLGSAILWHTAATLAGQLLCWWRVGAMLGGNLFVGLADFLTRTFAAHPNGNALLFGLCQYGVLSLPESVHALAYFLGSAVFNDSALRTETLNAFHFFVYSLGRQLIPSLIIQFSLIIGLFTALKTVHFGLASRSKPTLSFTPQKGGPMLRRAGQLETFSSLRLSRSTQGYLLALALTSLIFLRTGGDFLDMVGSTMLTAVTTVYSLLGASVLLYLLTKDRLKRTGFGVGFVAMLYLFFPTLLTLLGLFDQFLNLRIITPYHQEED